MHPITKRQSEQMLGVLDRLPEYGADLGAVFYDEMLAAHPELRPLFDTNLTAQIAVMNHTLRALAAIAAIEGALDQTVREIARRHVDYGVVAEHYVIAERTLLRALLKLEGVKISEEECAAWTALAREVSAAMMQETLAQTA